MEDYCKKYTTCDGENCLDEKNGINCSECKANSNLYNKTNCCPDKSFWKDGCKTFNFENAPEKYSTILDSCLYFEEDFKCLKCSNTDNKKLISDKRGCCAENTFIIL